MKRALTYQDVLDMKPCAYHFKQACNALRHWKTTAYTPSEMAEHGVKHSSIIWAWFQPSVMSPTGAIKAAALMSERVLPIFERAHPDDKRPRQVVEAALRYADGPSDANKEAARAAAWAAAAWATSAAERYACDRADEEAAQIANIEQVLAQE